jgi:hypothetical protein
VKKLLACSIMLFAALTTAYAAPATSASEIKSIDVSTLTPEQKASLMSQAAELQKQSVQPPANISETVRNEASAWGELGANMGKAAVSAAKEIGVAANDFVQTPLGKITMAIVIFKVIGASVIKLVVGGSLLVFFLSIALWLVVKTKYSKVEYEYVPSFFGKLEKKRVKSFDVDEDIVMKNYIAAAVSAALGLVFGLNIIF